MAWTAVALHGRSHALELLDEVRTFTASPRLVALSHVQQAVVHVSLSEWRPALEALERVSPTAFALLTPREQSAVLLNGGLANLSLLHLDDARAQLQGALALATEHSMAEQEFKARHNLGCLEFYAGRLPEAIRLMRAADAVDVPVARARARHDLAQVLLEAGLLDQARQTLVGALGEARAARLSLEEADIRLDLAGCALVESDATRARGELDAAVRIYRSRDAKGRQRSTSLLRAAVDVASGRIPRGVDTLLAPWLASARPVTPEERLAARVQAETRLLRGDVDGAAYAVQRLRRRTRQGMAGEMHDRLIFAKVAAAQGDSSRARREVHTALRRLTRRQAPTQSLEVRAALALHGRRLADFDLGDALANGSPRRVFDSVERWRAVTHRLPPVRTALDAGSAELMAELRQARLSLGSASSGDGQGRGLRARVAQLEWQIAQRDWSATEATEPGERTRERTSERAGVTGRRHDDPAAATTLARAQEALERRDETALVFLAHDGRQHVLAVGAHGARLNAIGDASTVEALAQQLLRDLRAHSFAATNPVMEKALARAVDSSLKALDSVLFNGADLSAHGGVVVAPGRALAGVPWGALPSLSGRPVTVATSMTHWAILSPAPQGSLRVTSLAGPGLRRAATEAAQVLDAWRSASGALELAGPFGEADGATLNRSLRRDTVLHVAAHGRHERQSPFFSSLQLADGPVFAHEFPRPVTAGHVVLSACDVGLSDVRPGDEPLGLTAALISLGVRSVVAAVAPVSDEVAADAMVTYHRQLARGIPASAALATTIARHAGARAFTLYGADWRHQIQRAGSLNMTS